MSEREREKKQEKERINEQVREGECVRDMFPLAVDETPEAAVMERADELEAWYTQWLFKNCYLPRSPIPLQKALYGAEGDAKREMGYGSAVTFRRYLNGKIWCSNPAYRITVSPSGKKLVEPIGDMKR